MPILAALSFIVQLGLCVHCVQTGRDRQWLYFIVFVPVVGSLVYFVTQMLPDLRGSRTMRQAVGGLARAVDPHAELRRRKDELAHSDNVDNRLRLADECMEVAFYDEAQALYESCLSGQHASDPNIALKLAEAQFAQERFAEARATLERIVAEHPEFRSVDGHLLYARTLEQLDDPGVAEEYNVLLETYPGEEARVRYAQWLEDTGDNERALALYREVLTRARRSPKYYRRVQKPWIDIAKQRVQ